MNTKKMWNMIAAINWAFHSKQKRGYENAKESILDHFDVDACRQIRLFVSDRKQELTKAIDAYDCVASVRVGNYGGDDSFDDMISHVVGLGEHIFGMVVDNPKLLNDIDYTESFMYCLPYEDDLKPHNPELEEAKEVIRTLIETLKEDGQFGIDVVTDALAFLRKR